MRYTYTFLFLLSVFIVQAQTNLTIPAIQGSGNSSTYSGVSVRTTGIVTAKYIGTGMINGFFLQDETGDGNPNTSDGIFVSTTTDNVNTGDKIQLTATVNELSGRTQLINPANITVLQSNQPLPITKVVFDPANFDWEKYEGMLLEFDQTLYVNSNYNLQRYGELELGDRRKPSPTNFVFPSTDSNSEYKALVSRNALPPVYLDDARTTANIKPAIFADNSGSRRLGERISHLRAVVDYINSKYVVYPAEFPVAFFGNPRPTSPQGLGDYNLKVCGFNLEYYLTSPNNSGMGPSSTLEMARQHTKIVAALQAIDADIYGLVEIEEGQAALTKLATALTAATGKPYGFVNDGTNVNGTYTKSAYLYRSDRVVPYLNLININSPSPLNRKKLQAFTLKENDGRFMFGINHFKAKSGCSSAQGTDTDQGDGQSCFNAKRVLEAEAVISNVNNNKRYYECDNALIMGDLNAYAKEDPITAFINAGYTDLHQAFHSDTSYSYVYRGETGYLDHALATSSMAAQVTGMTPFHINADEEAMFEYNGSAYQPDMYRCSDHDPVVVGIKLGEGINGNELTFEEKVVILPTLVHTSFRITNAENAYMQIFAINGMKMYEGQITSSEQEYSINELGLESGAYVVRLYGENSIVRRVIIVKRTK